MRALHGRTARGGGAILGASLASSLLWNDRGWSIARAHVIVKRWVRFPLMRAYEASTALPLAEGNAPAAQIIGRQLDGDGVPLNDLDAEFAQLAGQMRQDEMAILELYPKEAIGKTSLILPTTSIASVVGASRGLGALYGWARFCCRRALSAVGMALLCFVFWEKRRGVWGSVSRHPSRKKE